MRRRIAISFVVMSLIIAVAASAQMRGTGRLTGNVFDKSTGKPIAGATITVALPGGKTQPIVVKSDSRGHWAAIGMTSGQWDVDVAAPGYVTSRGTASISEVSATPAIKTDLEPEVKQEAVQQQVPPEPLLPPEVVDAL